MAIHTTNVQAALLGLGGCGFVCSSRISQLFAESVLPITSEQMPISFSAEQALQWTAIELAPEYVVKFKDIMVQRDVCQLACATTNVLTLHPAEERAVQGSPMLDSHRRLDLATQFMASKLLLIDLQETRMSGAKAVGIAQ